MLYPLRKKLAIFIFEGKIQTQGLRHRNPRVDKITIANHLIIIEAQAYIGKNLTLIGGAQHITGIAQDEFRSLHAVLHGTGRQGQRKAPVFRVSTDHATKTAIDPGEARGARLVVDDMPSQQRGDAGIALIDKGHAQGLRARPGADARPLMPVGSTKTHIGAKGQEIAFHRGGVKDDGIVTVLGE